MPDDAIYDDTRRPVAADGAPLEPQPMPRTAVDVAIARAGIRPVAVAARDAASERPTSNASFYLGVRAKFAVALVASSVWFALTIVVALPWIAELSRLAGTALAWFAVGGIALVPGFMNAFLIASLLLDRRPGRMQPSRYPAVSILLPVRDADQIASVTIQFNGEERCVHVTPGPSAVDRWRGPPIRPYRDGAVVVRKRAHEGVLKRDARPGACCRQASPAPRRKPRSASTFRAADREPLPSVR
jgi:hypothetical protein